MCNHLQSTSVETSGVPQGALLGPLYYINGDVEASFGTVVNIHWYADNSVFYNFVITSKTSEHFTTYSCYFAIGVTCGKRP